MNANIDFKDLWKQQESKPPQMDDLLSKVKTYRNAGFKRLLITNALLLATVVVIAFIWYYFQPQLLSTKIGMVLSILAMLIFLLAYNKLFGSYKTLSQTKSNTDYLEDLIRLKNKEKHIQTTMMKLYFILLSLGICLYLYEYVLLMSPVLGVSIYAITLAWFIFNWVYLRPRIVKKQEAKIDSLIATFKRINAQLEE